MARSSVVYRLKIELSDVDRNVYETLAFRIPQHPSESTERLIARILAYALLYEEQLEFAKGLDQANEPALWSHDLTGQLLHWVDVGTPAADRLHQAAKKADRVTVVCHKGEVALARETSKRKLHRAEEIQVLHLDPKFVEKLAVNLPRNSEWSVVHTDGELSVTIGHETHAGTVVRASLPQ